MNLYNAATWIWLGCSAVALIIAVVSLIQAIVDWRSPSRNRRLIRLAVGIAVLPVLFIGFKTLITRVIVPRDRERLLMERGDPTTLVRVGDRAPAFTVQEVDGRDFALDRQQGKVLLVNFFATWCGPCIEELPHLQKIWEANRDNSQFAMLVIGREEQPATVAEFKQERGFTFPMAADADRSVYSQYAKETIPRTYLIDKNGTIRFASVGYYEKDLDKLRDELARQLTETK